jgi:hypothetical protein
MRRVLLANDQTLRLVRVPGEAGVFSFLEYSSQADARRYLEEYAGDTMALWQMRMALAEDAMGLDVTQMDEAEVMDEVAWRVTQRQLTIAEELDEPLPAITEPEAASSSSAAPPPELPRSKKLTWIEVKVVWDRDGKPVKNLRLVVRTPDGVENFFDTNSEGKARVEEIEPGTCDVRCDMKNLLLKDTVVFASMGETMGPPAPEPQAGTSTLRIALVEEHKVKTGESIAGLAKNAKMPWQDLAKFNWGTAVPDEINKHLAQDVGCRNKTKDGKNYVFDSGDQPGIVYIPAAWSQSGLSTGGTHVIRVKRVGRRKAPFIFSF